MSIPTSRELSSVIAATMSAKRVSWRRYGLNGEKRRPIVHRFEVKGGATMMDAFVENLTRNNLLFEALKKKTKCPISFRSRGARNQGRS